MLEGKIALVWNVRGRICILSSKMKDLWIAQTIYVVLLSVSLYTRGQVLFEEKKNQEVFKGRTRVSHPAHFYLALYVEKQPVAWIDCVCGEHVGKPWLIELAALIWLNLVLIYVKSKAIYFTLKCIDACTKQVLVFIIINLNFVILTQLMPKENWCDDKTHFMFWFWDLGIPVLWNHRKGTF